METITSRQNPRIKALVRLRDRRERLDQGQFIIEGLRECQRALHAKIQSTALYLCPSYFNNQAAVHPLIETISPGTPIFELSPEVFDKVSLRENPDGVLLTAQLPQLHLQALKLPLNPLLLVVERVEKPGNLGALLRSADATGVSAVICADPLTDFYHPQVIRNSQGAIFSLPCVADTSSAVLSFLKNSQVRIVATTPDTKQLLWDCDLKGAIAISVGSESQGHTSLWLDSADERIRIPMLGESDSLNVSVSAALCLYEAVRQRR